MSSYAFRELDSLVSTNKLAVVTNKVLSQYSVLTKKWTEGLNSEWTCRHYFATKMILNATVLLSSAEYAEEKNLRVVRPYLEYYAVLSLLRCVVCTMPGEDWNGGGLIHISHKRAITLASECLSKFNLEEAEKLRALCKLLKAQRELISYRAPASGDSELDRNYDIIQICTVLAELAQFNSELLERSLEKHANPVTFVVLKHDIECIVDVELEGLKFHDHYDSMRLNYVQRKQPHPLNLHLFMTEGQTEDFIGVWDDLENNDDESYSGGSPCSWQTIFDIP